MLTRAGSAVQKHVVLLYFALVIAWGLAVDHPGALLRQFGVLKWIAVPIIVALLVWQVQRCGGLINAYGVNLPLLLLVCWVITSGVYNHTSLVTLVAWLFLYLKFVLFLVYVNNLPVRIETVTALLRCAAWFALFLAVEGYVRTALGMYGHPDQMSFVLGPHGTVNVGFICGIGIAYCSAYAFVHRRWRYLLLCLAMISVSVPGEIKALTLSGPIIAATVYLADLRSRSVRIPYGRYVVRSVAVLLGVAALGLGYRRFAGPDVSHLMLVLVDNLQIWLAEGGSLREAGLNRISTVAEVAAQMSADGFGLLVGRGPGSTFLVNADARLDLGGLSWNQIGMTMADIGVVGLTFFLWMLATYALPGLRLLSRWQQLDAEHRVVVLAFAGISLNFVLLAPLYDLVWRYDGVGYVFFVMVATLYRVRVRLESAEPGYRGIVDTAPALCAGER